MPTRAVIVVSVLARRAIQDKDTNSLSLIEIIERLEASAPAEFFEDKTLEGHIGATIEGQFIIQLRNLDFDNTANGTLHLTVVAPGGKEIVSIGASLSMAPGRGHRWVANVANIELAGSGLYVFKARWTEGEEQTESIYPLSIDYVVSEDAEVLQRVREGNDDEA